MNNMDSEKKAMLQNIGCKLQKYRKEANLTQEQLAELADVSQKHISRLERGLHVPHFDMIIKIAKVLSVPTDAFVEDFSADNINIFLQNMKPEIEGMSQNQLSFLKTLIRTIKQYHF